MSLECGDIEEGRKQSLLEMSLDTGAGIKQQNT
jgi:hypothetical protein